MVRTLRRALLWTAIASVCLLPSVAAQSARVPTRHVVVTGATNPVVGDLPVGPAEAASCRVSASANSHAVTVFVCILGPTQVMSNCTWDEWTTAAGTATSADPYTVVIPYHFDGLRFSVVNAGADTITVVCDLWGASQ